MASFVFFRNDNTGETFKLSLNRDGKVDVDNALAAIGASVVKWKDSDGFVCILEKEEQTTKSVHVFQPGETVAFQTIIEPRQQQQQIRYILPFNWRILDVNRVEIGPELVSELEDEAFNVDGPGLHTWAEVKTDIPRTDRTDVLYILFKAQADEECSILNPDSTWKERYSGAEYTAHVDQLNAWLQLPSSSGFGWLGPDKRQQYEKLFQTPRRFFTIGNRTDEVLVEKSMGIKGAVLGVELVKKLCWRGMFRSQLDFYLWATSSTMPYVQLYTDMVSGGIAHMCTGSQRNASTVWMVPLQNKQELQEFVQEFGKHLPISAANFTSDDYVELPMPPRCKYPFPGTQFDFIER